MQNLPNAFDLETYSVLTDFYLNMLTENQFYLIGAEKKRPKISALRLQIVASQSS